MVRSIFLTESTSWYEADSHLLKQSHAVEHVRSLTFLLHKTIKSDSFTSHDTVMLILNRLNHSRAVRGRTCAADTALGGMWMQGKVYMAPWTGLHWIPGTLLRIC